MTLRRKLFLVGAFLFCVVVANGLQTDIRAAVPGRLAVSAAGSGGFVTAAAGSSASGPEFRTGPPDDARETDEGVSGVTPLDSPVSVAGPTILGAAGLNHYENRTADNGNQFSIEPPDQAICVGNGFVIEAVNLAIALRDARTNTRIGGVTSLNRFFGQPSAIKRPAPFVFGPFLTDPKCLFDFATRRFFVTVLELDTDPATNAFTGSSHLMIAVSKTSDPRAGFGIFSLDVTNDGSNGISHPDCPCYGDQPLIGLDRNGLYISTNEFSLVADAFNGAQLYGISKWKLAAAANGIGGPIPVATINLGALATPDQGGIWYTVQPVAQPPADDQDESDDDLRGVEYFLSALEFFGVPDNRVALWGLTNTNSLQGNNPNVHISIAVVPTNTFYVSPPRSVQKPSAAVPNPRPIDGGDDRMQQVVRVNNTVYGSLTTAISGNRSGIAYWGIKPRWNGGVLAGRVRVEGMVSVAGNFLQRPSIAMNRDGNGLMAFSLIGPGYFPSAAYVSFNKQAGARGPVIITGAGVAPDIGFSGAGGGRQRWGDYSAAVDDQHNIWAAAEYIPITVFPAPGQLANWGTFIWKLTPPHDQDEE